MTEPGTPQTAAGRGLARAYPMSPSIVRDVLAIEAEARSDPHLHDGCFQRGTLTADYIERVRAARDAEVRAAMLALTERGELNPEWREGIRYATLAILDADTEDAA